MESICVRSEREYNVLIDCNWRDELNALAKGRVRIAVIYSEKMREAVRASAELPGQVFYFELPDGELAKDYEHLCQLWNWLGAHGFTRSDLIVAVGGGAITDVAGFAAASWLRGIDWIGIPTTVAGMVDASIGGKVAINSTHGKNLIGAFHSPIAVLIDLSWLDTLSDRDFSAGMAEVIKCGFIAQSPIVSLLENQSLKQLRGDLTRVKALVVASVEIKADVVSHDFKESFAREILNYGHTLGHAIEIHSSYSMRHGEAVAIGLVFAAELASIKNQLSTDIVDLHRKLLTGLNLPTTYPRKAWPELLPLLALDKKSRGNSRRFVALSDIGSVSRIEDPTEAELWAAYERISS